MYSLDNESGVAVMPLIKTQRKKTNEPQWFTEGGNGVAPSYPGADWFNIVQAELLNLLKEANITPQKTKLTQLTEAIKTIISRNIIETYPYNLNYIPEDDDLNNYRNVGIYHQSSSARAKLERNYPITIAGILEVLYNGNYQRYTTFQSHCYERDFRNGSWQAWRRTDALDKFDKSGGTISGNVKAKDFESENGNSLASSYGLKGFLGSNNLNNLYGANHYGIWHQHTDANSKTDLNYPESRAGTLLVLPNAYQGIQLYYMRGRNYFWMRASANNNNSHTWSEWQKIGEVIDNLSSDSQTGALSARQGKNLDAKKFDKTGGTVSGNVTVGGTLTLDGVGSSWTRAIFNISNGGNWRLEFNPNSETDSRFNVVYTTKGNAQRYIAFPQVSTRETVAYQSWVLSLVQDNLVGIPLPYPLTTVPTGFLAFNGQAFNKTFYPRLAKLYPSGILPDLRGEFIRGWDNGRGVDSGRLLLSNQGDAIRNIKGEITTSTWAVRSTGLFERKRQGEQDGDGNGRNGWIYEFDASRVVPTADENRPRNIAFQYICLAG